MTKHNQDGAINILVVPLILAILILIGVLIFSSWAYNSRQDYKNNTDQKIADAVQIADQQESSVKDKQFAEAEKSPLKTYNGPEAYGSMVLNYPKTWSGYVDATGSGDAVVDGYFNPGVVPSITDQNSVFALRVQVLSAAYNDTLNDLQSNNQQNGGATISPYALPKVPKVVGVEVQGQIADSTTGTMVILPLRNETLEIYTEGSQFTNDFNTYILPNFSFSP